MSTDASQKDIAAARAYEALHVPALFQQFAPLLLDAVQLQSGQRVLDIACGTGVVAREALVRLGGDGSVMGLDANAGMLAVATELAPSVDWRLGSATALPLEDASFDIVSCQFGLMFFEPRVTALQEMLRVLVPGGRCVLAVWDSLEHSEAYPEAVALLEEMAGEQAASALRAPFSLGDREALRGLCEEAGFTDCSVATYHGVGRFPSIRTMVEADLRGWLPVMGVELPESLIQAILARAEALLSGYVTRGGTVEFDAPAHILCATKP